MSSDNQQRSLRVFLCHATEDKPKVYDLYTRLKEEGIDVWLDKENLLPGQDWQLEIPNAVKNSDIVIVCLSKSSISKEGYIQKEIRLALDAADEKPEGTIYIIPAKLEECDVPQRLTQWQWVNLFDLSERGYDRLLISLRLRASRLGINFFIQNNSEDKEAQKDKPVSLERISQPVVIKRANHDIYIFAGIDFIKIPSGKFRMRINDKYGNAEEKEVEIAYEYWISRYPVTNQQFFEFSNSARRKHNWVESVGKKLDHPVRYINFEDAIAYCRWLGKNFRRELPIGYIFRLPNEEEWEKAGRGNKGYKWPWGNNFPPKDIELCNSKESNINDTTPVGFYSPEGDSTYGVADMAGNVWEWTRSSDIRTRYQILRGGSYDSGSNEVSCLYRREQRLGDLELKAQNKWPYIYPNTTERQKTEEEKKREQETEIRRVLYLIDDYGLRLAICPYPNPD